MRTILGAGVISALAFWAGWYPLAAVGLAATCTLVLIKALSHTRDPMLPQADSEAREEFTLHFPNPDEHGWLRCTVHALERKYVQEECYGGPPVRKTTFAYDIKGDHVFGRMIDLCEEDFRGTHFETVNGELLLDAIKERRSKNADEHLANLKKQMYWTKIEGSLRYLILAIHRTSKSFFMDEERRIEWEFAALKKMMSDKGATREPGSYFKAPEDASEALKAEILELQGKAYLGIQRLTFGEIVHYEHILKTLERVARNPMSLW